MLGGRDDIVYLADTQLVYGIPHERHQPYIVVVGTPARLWCPPIPQRSGTARVLVCSLPDAAGMHDRTPTPTRQMHMCTLGAVSVGVCLLACCTQCCFCCPFVS
jgi:hypothetical protein